MTPISVSSAWTRRGIQTRVVFLMGLGMLASLGVLGGTSWVHLNSLTGQLLEERTLLARSVAEHLDYVVRGEMESLQGLASSLQASDAPDQTQPAERDRVRETYLRSHLLESVFLVDPNGGIVTRQPAAQSSAPGPRPDLPEIQTAFRTGRPTVSALVHSGTDSGRLYVFVPVRNWRSLIVALAGGEINPAGQRFVSILEPFRLGTTGSADLVDSHGVVIGSSDKNRVFLPSEHATALDESIRGRLTTVTTIGRGEAREVVALAPLASAPWTIIVRQREREALAQVFTLRRTLLWLAPSLLAVALLFAWGAARSVRHSLAVLSDAAGRIAAGELTRPIPGLPEDEVGQLGRSLERMRVALRSSIETVARANQELERRVEERTRELERLNQQLKEREERRGETLRKVISAQEDERKRIARELHDATSQELSALAIGLETALAAFPSDLSKTRLAEAKALTVRALEELHRLILDLRPSVLDDLGLLSAIRWSAERHLEPKGIAVRCEFGDIETRFAPEVETALFRVVQEAITNIARHSKADTALIQCAERDGNLTIEIEDDGEGFDMAGLPPPGSRQRGLGLLGMRERVELLGGTLEVDSAPGQGVRIMLTVPLSTETTHG
jgi:signal transduction histidine kinase